MLSYRTKGTATLFPNSPPGISPIDSIDPISKNPTKLHQTPPQFSIQLKLSNRSTNRDDKIAIIIRVANENPSKFDPLHPWIPSLRSRYRRQADQNPSNLGLLSTLRFRTRHCSFAPRSFALAVSTPRTRQQCCPLPPPATFHRSYRICSREHAGQLSLTRPTTNTRGLDNEPCPCRALSSRICALKSAAG